MLIKKRFVKIPDSIIENQKNDPLTADLYICELSELLISKEYEWKHKAQLNNHLLLFCTKGDCILKIDKDEIHLKEDQFCIVPEGFRFEAIIGNIDPTIFLTCMFNGSKSKVLEREFTVVRDIAPSINNMVANRKMLFDEIFNNSTRGYLNANMHYINFTFAHLLATFIFASKTSDDIFIEENPVVQKTIKFMELNIDKKLSLRDIADEVGYSQTYLSTIFKKETNYSPISYFSHLKITKACEFLDQTKQKIKEIAFMLGYSDPYYFSKDFQKKMGISPRNYRKRIGG
jgi:YesN/AraC family two-component response regulator